MRIHPSNQHDADIDWFATDAAGYILHVASGGGRLPESVAADEAVLLELHAYFLTLPETTAAEPGTGLTVNSPTYPSHARYARRGLFSFAKTDLHNGAHRQYHVVARPARPLTVAELPEHLAELLDRTQWPGCVGAQTVIDGTTIA